MDPMVGSAAVCSSINNHTDSSDNADLLDFCFLCSRQFFHDNLDNYGMERLKDEDVLETFFEELGPVDRSLLQCCPACKALCGTLIRTKEALSSLIDEITGLLLRSRKVSFLLSKSRVVSRLFQSSNSSLPPCETSSSYLQQPLSQMTFPKDATHHNSNLFATQFDLRLDSSNLSVSDLDLGLTPHSTPISVIKRSPLASSKSKKDSEKSGSPSGILQSTSFCSAYNESIMNSVSDNACDITEGVIRHHHNASKCPFTPPGLSSSPKKSSTSPSAHNQWKKPTRNVSKKLNFNNATMKGTKENVLTSTEVTLTEIAGQSSMAGSVSNEEKRDCTISPLDQHGISSLSTNNILQYDGPTFSNGKSKDPKPEFLKQENNIQSDGNNESKHHCAQCNKSFQCARNLRNHLAAHNQERKFICEICGVSYRHKVGLEAHVSIHNGDSKFQCDICKKCFTQKSGLQRHLRIHTRKFQFQCDACGKQFLHHSSFKAHKLVHVGTREFKCPDCELTFSQKSHLQRHRRIHTGEKPYKCDFCQRSFSERYNLQVHLKIHEDNPKNLFKCTKCLKSFTRKFKLKQHINKVH